MSKNSMATADAVSFNYNFMEIFTFQHEGVYGGMDWGMLQGAGENSNFPVITIQGEAD
ncbi:MAG: hypothetical protein P4L27_08505 [Ignavibacteriaceae bacterium]|nr:hypothetical protein [Ignavibacteriaceae bacterium]